MIGKKRDGGVAVALRGAVNGCRQNIAVRKAGGRDDIGELVGRWIESELGGHRAVGSGRLGARLPGDKRDIQSTTERRSSRGSATSMRRLLVRIGICHQLRVVTSSTQ